MPLAAGAGAARSSPLAADVGLTDGINTCLFDIGQEAFARYLGRSVKAQRSSLVRAWADVCSRPRCGISFRRPELRKAKASKQLPD